MTKQVLSARLSETFKVLEHLGQNLSRGEVHRLRVATRRLHAIFEILSLNKAFKPPKGATKSVKFLTNQLGEIRSLDVSLKLWRSRFAIPGIDEQLKKLAKQARSRMAEKIGKKDRHRIEKTIQQILGQLHHGGSDLRAAWEKSSGLAEKRAARAYGDYRSHRDIESLHELRIRLKQWRYLLELDSPRPETRAKIARLKSLQDDIGSLHDMEVLRDLLKKGRMKRVALEAKAGHDLKEIRRQLKAAIRTGQQGFSARQARALASIFPKEKA